MVMKGEVHVKEGRKGSWKKQYTVLRKTGLGFSKSEKTEVGWKQHANTLLVIKVEALVIHIHQIQMHSTHIQLYMCVLHICE